MQCAWVTSNGVADAMTDNAAADLVRSYFAIFAVGDREAAERMIAADFHFTSPYDNRIDRVAYFDICWANAAAIDGFEFDHLLADGDTVAVTYVARTTMGKRFRNTEIFRCRDGRIVEVEVYFGWSLPHTAAPRTHADPA
jgi:ketosteroid isomerase-like protein